MSKTTVLYKDIAPGAAEDAAVTATEAVPGSSPSLLPGGITPSPTCLLERNYWMLNGKHKLAEHEPIAFWSAEISGEDGVFQNKPVITISFDKQYSSVGITLVFDRAAMGYCNSVYIAWYQNDTLKAERTFSPNAVSFFCQQNVESYNKVVITLNSTHLPFRRAKMEQIIFGIHRYFDMEELRSASIVNETSLINSELPVSTFDWKLESADDVEYMFQLKQPVEARNDGQLIGVYYIDKSERTSVSVYSISCNDAFGVLGESPFSGGAYLAGVSAKSLLAAIIDGDFPVSYDDDVKDITLKGILLPSTKREAIHQVLFAWGVSASTDGGYGIRIFTLPTAEKEIGEKRTYTGASVTTNAIVTKISVAAHTYTENSSGGIEIGGKKYSDTTTEYIVSNPNVTATDKKNVVEIKDCTLISPEIGQQTAQRVYDYYLKRNTIKAKFVWRGEKVGDLVTLPNSWGKKQTGHLARMEIKLSNTVAVNCEAIGQ